MSDSDEQPVEETPEEMAVAAEENLAEEPVAEASQQEETASAEDKAEEKAAPVEEEIVAEEPAAEEPQQEETASAEDEAEEEAAPAEEEIVAEEPAAEEPEQEETAPAEDEVEEEAAPVEEEIAAEEPAAEEPQKEKAASAEDKTEEEEPTTTRISAVQEVDDGRAWYVVHCYSGYENKVRHNLEQRIESMGMKDSIFDVVVPTEEEIEVKDGKRRSVERRVFPGYILVNMLMDEESWYIVRNTPGVTNFVGMGNEPIPLRPEEVSQIIKRMETDAPRIKVTFKQGERVRIVDGPFNDFRGTVDVIDMERAKVRVMVNFFGRDTPVELDFLQVEKS